MAADCPGVGWNRAFCSGQAFETVLTILEAAITVYAPTIFAEAGYDARKSQWLSGLNDVRVL